MLHQDFTQTALFEKVLSFIEPSDCVFASFPKSGRTWVRFVLQHYASVRHGAAFDLRPRLIAGLSRFRSIVFTHDYFDFAFDTPGEPFIVFEPQMRKRGLVLLVRDPRDTIVSQFHWTTKHRKATGMPIDEFARSPIYGAERTADFVLKLLDAFEHHPGPKHLMIYEECRKEPGTCFAELLRFVDQESFSAEAASIAIDRSAFGRMQQLEMAISQEGRVGDYRRIGVESWDGDINALKVRRGAVGGYLEEAPWLNSDEFPLTRRLVETLHGLSRR
jgi:hypothetical protein